MPKGGKPDGGTTSVAVLTSVSTVTVPENGTATFQVKLSSNPGKNAVVRIARTSGDSDITVASGAELQFNRKNYSTWQTVTLTAAGDADTAPGQAIFTCSGDMLESAVVTATEQDTTTTPSYSIVPDSSAVTVPEGGSVQFGIRLSADPGRMVTVTTGRVAGDADITIDQGAVLNFDSTDWNVPKAVTFSAANDSDTDAGQAIFTCEADGATTVTVTATEQDTGTGTGTSQRIVVDPVSRIEGHLRIEVEIADGRVSKAWSSGTLFRGVETILNGRSPYDAPHITQRLCGVCTYIHQLCSTRSIEDAAGVTVSPNARLVRNLSLGAQFMHDHMVHFYHLHGLDWADLVSALSADTSATSALAAQISPDAAPIDFAAVKTRLQGLVDKGSLGPFANAYWGHSSYLLSPEENLLMVAHYLAALRQQVRTAKLLAILGGKSPHPQSTVVGGVTCGSELSPQRLGEFRTLLDETREFVRTVYMPDVKLVASRYRDWGTIGGYTNFLSYGEFPLSSQEPEDLFFPRGHILAGDVANVLPVDLSRVTEHVARSWYQGSTDRHPSVGETAPAYTGLDVNSRYSWLKAPRYNGQAMEVGPLARILVGYGLGRTAIVSEVDNFLSETGLPGSALMSTLGRTAARAMETGILGEALTAWLGELENNLANNILEIFRNHDLPSESQGIGLNEAARGALGHWLTVSAGKVGSYQMVVPSTWNFGPRCDAGIPGPMEKALIGTPVADPANPVEVLRVIHSFDPCIACGVHVIDTKEGSSKYIQVI